MITLKTEELSPRHNNELLAGSIIPRPIAWVTTLSPGGIVNAAPFSFFNMVCDYPPLISIAIQRKDGNLKDTARNAAHHREFVVHMVEESYMDKVHLTAADLGPEESEVTLAGLEVVQSELVKVPALTLPRIRIECKVDSIITIGEGETQVCDLLIGKVVIYHVDADVYDVNKGCMAASVFQPVAHLFGSTYWKLGQTIELDKP